MGVIVLHLENNPSNQLYHNRVRDFPHAMELVVRMCRKERVPNAQIWPDDAGGAVNVELNAALDLFERLAHGCRFDYLAGIETPEQLIARWKASECGELQEIGEALRTGDYKRLAI